MKQPWIRVDHWGESLWLIVASGEHDLATVPDLDDALDTVRRDGTDVILDFSEATFVDSSIARAVIEHARRQGERVAIVSPPNTEPRRLFDLLRLELLLPVCQTRDDALRALGR